MGYTQDLARSTTRLFDDSLHHFAGLSAQWGTDPLHAIQAVAFSVFARQASDGSVVLHVGDLMRGRLACPPQLPLDQVARSAAGLLPGVTDLEISLCDAGGGEPQNIRVAFHDRGAEGFEITASGTARQQERLTGALRTRYGADALVADVPLVCGGDRLELRRWDQTLFPIPATTLDAVFSQMARTRRRKSAILAGNRRLTYGDAEDRADRLAATLVRSGVQLGEPIVTLCDDPITSIVHQLAVLKAGAVCIPTGPVPAPSAQRTAALTGARVALGRRAAGSSWSRYCRLLATDDPDTLSEGVDDCDDSSLPRSGFSDVAYLLVNRPGAAEGLQLSAHEAWTSVTASRIQRIGDVSSDIAVCAPPWSTTFLSAMWWAFACGGTLRWQDPSGPQAVHTAAQRLAEESGTDAVFTPDQYGRILQAPSPLVRGGPRAVVLVGDVPPRGLPEQHLGRYPESQLWLEFCGGAGPLPWTVRDLGVAVHGDLSPTDVGHPTPNVRIRVLDESGQALPAGFPGEMCAHGAALPCESSSEARHPTTAPGELPLHRSGRLSRRTPAGSVEVLHSPHLPNGRIS